MALSQYYGNTPNHLALALGGTPTPDQWTEWLALLHSFGGTLHLCFDNDSQGASYLSTVESTYRGDYLILNLPQGVKDVADLLLGGEEPTYRTFTVPPNILGGDALLPTDEDRLSSAYVTTGYHLLDNLIGGYRGGSMIMLAGHPKAGKSTFLSALVVNYLKLSPTHKVLYIPLELSHTETLYTLASAHLAKPLPSCEPEEVLDAMRQLIPQLLMLRHFGYLPIEQLEETLAVIPKLGVTMLVLDHITAACTSFTDGLATRLLDSSLSYIQATLNRYQIPAIIVTHVNSSGLQSNDMLSPQHLRGSLALAQLPSVVLGVRRIDEGVTEVYTITPDRYTGKTGRIQFDYNGTFTPYKRGGDKFTL
jgi:hypothetical protein